MLLRLRRDEGGALGFIPAEVARRLTALSSLTPVPGARAPIAGIALADGAVVTVLRIGEDAPQAAAHERASYDPGEDWIVPGADRAVLCHLGGADVALTGATVLATGVFDAASEGGVLWRGEVVPVIDVRALYAQAEASAWAERAVTPSPRAGRAPSLERLVATGWEDPGATHAGDGRRAILPDAPGEGAERGSIG